MKRVLPISVPCLIRRECHENKLPDGFVEVDYGENDGSGSFSVRGVYHPQRKTLYHGIIETTGDYDKWSSANILHELALDTSS